MRIDPRKIFFFAPNVHTGGGLVLLMDVIRSCPFAGFTTFFLDSRAKSTLGEHVQGLDVYWCGGGFKGRLGAEWHLKKLTRENDIILCFHNIPPLFARSSLIKVFMQNRLLIDSDALANYRIWTRIRTVLEVALAKRFSSVVEEYIVQTDTMRFMLTSWLKSFRKKTLPTISVLPFAKEMYSVNRGQGLDSKIYDFIYIADGESHKNHSNLLDAWVILANKGVYPSLVLTLPDRDIKLKNLVSSLNKQYNLRVVDLGVVEHNQVSRLYESSRALIFPSTLESFGLPLIEASHLELPIIASELDFVRDVCRPVETFNPYSSISISRAILRFLSVEEEAITILSSEAFWRHFQPHQ